MQTMNSYVFIKYVEKFYTMNRQFRQLRQHNNVKRVNKFDHCKLILHQIRFLIFKNEK